MANYTSVIIDLKGERDNVINVVKNNVLVTPEYVEQVRERNKIVSNSFRLECSEIGKIDMNILIPTPTDICQLDLTSEIEKKYGVEKCWYDWRFKNWGIGWNVANTYFADWLADNWFSLEFDLKWAVPTKWVEKLVEICKENNVEISGKFANEDFNDQQGYISTNEDGEVVWNFTKNDRQLYESIWGEGLLDEEE